MIWINMDCADKTLWAKAQDHNCLIDPRFKKRGNSSCVVECTRIIKAAKKGVDKDEDLINCPGSLGRG